MGKNINQPERSTEGQNKENKGNKIQQQSQEKASELAETLGDQDTRSLLDQEMTDVDIEYAAFVAGKAKKINDPVTVAVNTVKNMRRQPLSPRDFRDIGFHGDDYLL